MTDTIEAAEAHEALRVRTRELERRVRELESVLIDARDHFAAAEHSRQRYAAQLSAAQSFAEGQKRRAEKAEAELAAAREALRDAVSVVSQSRKGSIGGIGTHHIAQIPTSMVDSWRAALGEQP